MAQSADDRYQVLSHREYAYKVSDVYLGSDDQQLRESWLYDIANKKMFKHNIQLPQGVERTFLEILSNATDNSIRSRRAGVTVGPIIVTMDNRRITVRNSGLCIPIQIHRQYSESLKGTTGAAVDMWTPSIIFGVMLSSSNYEGDREGAGRNGLGAKLTNIYSHMFHVDVLDAVNHLSFSQTWTNNMEKMLDPIITQYHGQESVVQITFDLDLARFKYPSNEYPAEAFYLYARHCADASFNAKTTVQFNEVVFNHVNMKDYASLYFPGLTNTNHITWSSPDYSTEFCLVDTPDNGQIVSYVNGLVTADGGVHVDSVIKVVSGIIIAILNGFKPKGKSSAEVANATKGKKASAKKTTTVITNGAKTTKELNVNIADVKPHVSLLISCHVINPKYANQTKTKLNNPTPVINLGEKETVPLMKWKLIERIHQTIEFKQALLLKKTDGKKKRYLKLDKGVDANEAGGPKSGNCSLYVVEGLSASGYATQLISLTPNGRDLIGVLPLKGKMLNVMNANFRRIAENQELNCLKQMLGLQEGIDYTTEAGYKTLRYGYIILMTDADVDGKHITGLFLNYINCRFPTLLVRGAVMYLRTPIIRVMMNKRKISFYTQGEYEMWKRVTPDSHRWESRWYKGLGSSSDEEIAEDYKQPRIVMCIYDEATPQWLRLAFDDKLADSRKQWIANWKAELEIDLMIQQPISTFVDKELVQYGVDNLHRNIPNIMDGLKISRRKVIFTALDKWGYKKTEKSKKMMKVAQFANKVANKTNYHHDENCLATTIISMAQVFVGSNNMEYFVRQGQFGTRMLGGKDAANPRYSHTKPAWWLKYVFMQEDQKILTTVIEEGQSAEPTFFVPIIPPEVIDGVQGIGSGHMSFIPQHHPMHVTRWLEIRLDLHKRGIKEKLTDCQLERYGLNTLTPWYRGFTGEISCIRKNIVKRSIATSNVKQDVEVPTTNNMFDIEEDESLDSPEISIENETSMDAAEVVVEDDEDDSSRGDEHRESSRDDRFIIEGELLDGSPDTRPMIMASRGVMRVLNQTQIEITEIPVGRWINPYLHFIQELMEEKKIKKYRNLCKGDKPHFIIDVSPDFKPDYKNMKLEAHHTLTNMVLLMPDNTPKRFNTVADIMEEFFQLRLPYYEPRRQQLINDISVKIQHDNDKVRFIQLVREKKIIYMDRKKSDIHVQMDAHAIPRDLLASTKISQFTLDEIQLLLADITKLQAEKDYYTSITAADLWLIDLNKFKVAYVKHYKNDL